MSVICPGVAGCLRCMNMLARAYFVENVLFSLLLVYVEAGGM